MLLLLSRFSRVQLCDPIDGSPLGSHILGILQARTLEWVAISFSNAWKWKVKVKSLSRVRPSATPWTAAYQAPPSIGFSRPECWSGVPLPSPLSSCRQPSILADTCVQASYSARSMPSPRIRCEMLMQCWLSWTVWPSGCCILSSASFPPLDSCISLFPWSIAHLWRHRKPTHQTYRNGA